MVVWNFIYLFPYSLDVFIDVREWQVAMDWIQNLDWCLLYCFHVHICHKLWLYLFMCVIHNIALRSLKCCWVNMYCSFSVRSFSGSCNFNSLRLLWNNDVILWFNHTVQHVYLYVCVIIHVTYACMLFGQIYNKWI